MPAESQAIHKAAAEFISDRHLLGAFVNGLLRDFHSGNLLETSGALDVIRPAKHQIHNLRQNDLSSHAPDLEQQDDSKRK